MIWFTLALFVISFLIVALLTPKPEIENARAQTLDDVNFPRATEDAPVPLILGKIRMKAPNVTWYGNFRTEPITEKIKTGLFSSKRVVVAHRYFLTMDLALAMGPGVVMREVYVDDKIAWTGNTGGGAAYGVSGIGISFGGYKEGGAMSMGGVFYSGSFDIGEQPVDSIIEDLVGAGGVPAYLGTSHISLDGELGESAQLRKMAFVLECYTNSLGITGGGKIGDDMNPAEALYQIMTDQWRGLGISPSLIDTTTLAAIGEVLYTEGNGVSVQVTAEATGKKVVEEILRQIDGVAYQDPATGRIVFKLIRDDYDPDLLDIYDESDIIKIENFSRSGWDEVMAQVKISFPQRESDSDAVAISQDMATAGMVGRLRSTTLSMPFCYDKNLANQLASRERAQLSVPLFRMTLQMNRNANTLRPGSVFKVSWADYGISELVMRVQEFDFGSLLDGKLVVRCLQDNFALDTVVFLPPPDTGWVAPVVEPTEILVSEILEMPRFFMNRVQFPIEDLKAGVIPLAVKPSSASSSYDLLAGIASGNLDVREPQQVVYASTGTLLAAYDQLSGFAGGYDTTDGFTLINVTNGDNFVPAASEAEARQGEIGLLYGNGEFMAFRGVVDNGNGSWTFSNIYRGLLGTAPKTHPLGTRFYQLTVDMYGEGTLDDLTETGTLYYKLLDRVGPESIDPADIAEASKAMVRWARRPQRVRNLRLDGSRTAVLVDSETGAVDLTWARSNREASLIALESSADETPDISDAPAEVYDVEIYNNGALVPTLSSDGNSGTSKTIDFSLVALNGPGEARVIARWDYAGTDYENIDYAFLPFTFSQVVDIAFADLWDTYGEIAAADIVGSYALRRRVSDYTGPLIRIRDSNDDSEQDVGQNEVGKLAPFTVVGTPYVVKIYDQSGNNLDLTAPTNAEQPQLVAHPFRATEYTMLWDDVDDGLYGPTFNAGAPNAHAIGRGFMWANQYRTANPSGANAYLFIYDHDSAEDPSLDPFLHTGLITLTTGGFRLKWDEGTNLDTGVAVYRGPVLFGAEDGTGIIAVRNEESQNVGGAYTFYSTGDTSTPDWSGTELKRLVLGNRGDGASPNDNIILEAGVIDNLMPSLLQRRIFMNSMSKELMAREILLINDANGVNATEYAQGSPYPAAALNPDREVTYAVYCYENSQLVDISYQTWDDDTSNEIGIYLNGIRLGYGAGGGNNAWSATHTINSVTLRKGWNVITFRQETTVTFVWGVRNLAVTSLVDPAKVLWASFEGADAAVAYTERSFNRRAFTFVGNAQLDTAQSKFGNSSLLLDGTGDYVTLPDDADWEFGSGRFTLEGHFRWNSVAAATWLIAHYNTTGNQRSWGLYWDGTQLRLVGSENGSTVVELVTPYTWTPTVNTWYHIAADFDGTTYRLYLDGTVVATGVTLRTLFNSTDTLRIGAAGGSTNVMNGWIDEVKIYKGKAMYAGNMVANGSEA